MSPLPPVVPPLPAAGWHIAVLVPARDEELLLARCLRSVRWARQMLPADITTDLIVTVDSSTDGSLQIAREWTRDAGTVVQANVGGVGAARALAAQVGLSRSAISPDRCWLANTDADCEVPATWLVDHLAAARSGYAAVAGIVDVDSFEGHDAQVPERFRTSYEICEDGSHPHVHGANLGVRADAYLAVGGWNDLRTAEDHDLWRRLNVGGYHIVADARLKVLTSGRMVGRAPHGFADALAAHNGGTS